MTPREIFDRQLELIEAGDLDGLVSQYAEDATLVRFDRTISGREALRAFFAEYLAARPRVREVLAYGEAPDVVSYQAVLETAAGEVRAHGALFLRDGRIARQVAGTFPGTAAATAPRATGSVEVEELEPYVAWEPRPVPDPRGAGRDQLMPAVMEIVEAEGPVLAGRAFGLYTRAAGGKKLTTAAKAPLTGAAWRLKVQERLVIEREGATTIENDDVLRAAGAPRVRVRELGPRTLEEVPLDEVAALMARLRDAGVPGDLKRAVLDTYGLVRLTTRADEYLTEAQRRAGA